MSLILKRKNNSDAITPYDDAILLYSILGNGVLNDVYNSFKGSVSGMNFEIQSGIIIFGGREVQINKGSTVLIDVTTFVNNRTPFYLNMNVTIASDETASTVSIYASTKNEATSSGPESGATGSFIMCLFYVSSALSISEKFTRIRPGIATNCENLLSDGNINGVPFWNIFLSDMSGVNYAHYADYASEARGFVGGDKNKVSDGLYLPNRNLSLVTITEVVNETNMTISAKGTKNITFSRTYTSADKIFGVYYSQGSGFSHAAYSGEAVEEGKSALMGNLRFSMSASSKTITLENTTSSSLTFSQFQIVIISFGS